MPFDDIVSANDSYSRTHRELATGRARKGLAIVTCMDSRIDPLGAFGLVPGDAKIIRNAGARVTDDVVRTLAVAVHALGVDRIALMQHTDCGMVTNSQETLAGLVENGTGRQVDDLDFLTIQDQRATLRADADKIRRCELLPDGIEVGEFVFNVADGKLEQLG